MNGQGLTQGGFGELQPLIYKIKEADYELGAMDRLLQNK